MENNQNKKNIDLVKILTVFNYLNFLYISFRIVTIILAEGGMVAFSKKNIIATSILMILNYVYSSKSKKIGNKKSANLLLIFGVILTIIVAFYVFMIIVSNIYPAY